jgi:hypothetical protein
MFSSACVEPRMMFLPERQDPAQAQGVQRKQRGEQQQPLARQTTMTPTENLRMSMMMMADNVRAMKARQVNPHRQHRRHQRLVPLQPDLQPVCAWQLQSWSYSTPLAARHRQRHRVAMPQQRAMRLLVVGMLGVPLLVLPEGRNPLSSPQSVSLTSQPPWLACFRRS